MIVAVFLAIAAGGSAFLYVGHKKASQGEQAREHFAQAMQQLRASSANPMVQVFSSKDISRIDKTLEASDVGAKVALLQGGVVYFDTHPEISWSATEYNQLAQMLFGHLQKMMKSKEDRRAMAILFHLSKRAMARASSPELTNSLNEKLNTGLLEKDPYGFSIYTELATVARPSPSGTLKMLEACVQGRDLGIAQGCMSMAEQIADAGKQKEWLTFLSQYYERMKAPLKPFAARVFFARHALIPNRADELLKVAAKSNEESWQDVFLFGVAEMNKSAQFRARLQELSAKAESPIIRQKAVALIR